MQTVAMLTTAPPGGYKSFSRGPAFCLGHWLPEYEGVLYTTIPLVLSEVEKEAARRWSLPSGVVRRRVQVIGRDDVQRWTAIGGVAGPWEWPMERLKGAHLQFDEFHLYAPRTGEVERRRKWREWLREIRHEGATIEFLTQDPDGVDKEVRALCGVRLSLVNQETERDPFFGIAMSDWYELKAKHIGYWSPCVWVVERRKVDNKWVVSGKARKVYPCPRLYACYNSWSKPHKREGDAKGAVVKGSESVVNPNRKQYERRGLVGLYGWFLRKNIGRLGGRFVFLGFLWWLFLGAGGVWSIGFFNRFVAGIGSRASKKAALPADRAPATVRPGREKAEKAKEKAPSSGDVLPAPIPDVDLPGGVLFSTAFEGEPFMEYRIEDFQGVVLSRAALLQENDALQAAMDAARLDRPALVMLRPGRAYYDNGQVLGVGGWVRCAAGVKIEIEGIDYASSEVRYTGGDVDLLRLRESATGGRSGGGVVRSIPDSGASELPVVSAPKPFAFRASDDAGRVGADVDAGS